MSTDLTCEELYRVIEPYLPEPKKEQYHRCLERCKQ